MTLIRPLRLALRLSCSTLLSVIILSSCKKDDERPPIMGGDGDGEGDGDGDGDSSGGGDVGGGGTTGAGDGDGDGDTGSGTGGFNGYGGLYGSGGGSGGTPPSGLPCGDTFCPFNAACDETGEAPTCVCAPGLEAPHCTDINECSDREVCGETAVCLNFFGGYSCECLAGYTGDDCGNEDECEFDPCDADATCGNAEGGYTCVCDAGSFGTGHACQGADSCDGDPCGSSGTCVTSPDGARCQCDVGYSGTSSCTACGSTLEIPDAGLRAAINVALGRATDDDSDITMDLLSTETYLDASGYDIQSLTGLQCWPNLDRVDLSENEELTNLEPLAGLNRMTQLNISCTGVTSLGALAAHPTLQFFTASALNCGSELANLDGLASLAELRTLDLSGHSLSDFSDLAGLEGLEVLVLTGNALSNFDDLANLRLLRELYVSGNSINSVTGLSAFSRLEELSIANNQLTSLSGLSSMTRLRTVDASGNDIGSMGDVSSMAGLRTLFLGQNQLNNVSFATNLGQVTYLDVSGNQIATLEPMVGGALKGTFSFYGNPLPCATEAENIQTLASSGLEMLGACEE
jgi:Leucine-rich repeat (LRR) protein